MRGVGVGMRGLLCAGMVAVAVGVVPIAGSSAAASPSEPFRPCTATPQPYAGVPGARLDLSEHTSKDAVPVRYQVWSGTVPSFDGTPLSVDVTIPCADAAGSVGEPIAPHPTVTMLHGFTDDKAIWEETGKSDTVLSKDRPGPNSRWNDIWFASRGYVVLTYTARGWHDSCGPQTPPESKAACASHQGWIHLDDKRWEVRDAQWLTAGLVQSGVSNPKRLAITGGSYGGAPSASAALLAGNVMCGADPVPVSLGVDPCAGKRDGELTPWKTPDGQVRLDWAAALPLYTFADLLQVLAPNGRGSDGWGSAPKDASHTKPFGVPLASTVSGLVLAGKSFGVFAEPGTDPDSDILTTTDRLLAGDPFPHDEKLVTDSITTYERFKSPVTTKPQGSVPIFWVQGFTDALFPGSEALTMLKAVRRADADYPIKVFLGDIGHDYAAERQDDWDLVKDQMNAFLDHYLRPDRTPEEPTFDVGASFTRCLDHDADQRYVRAGDWHELHPGILSLRSEEVGRTSTAKQGPSGVATDPISTATLPGPKSYKGCRLVKAPKTDRTAATYRFPLDEDAELLGGPVVRLDFDTTGSDTPLAVRVWDVAADGSVKGLVTRGVFRVDGGPGKDKVARFQLSPQAYRFDAGHTLEVEITANDSPYLLANNQAAEVTVRGVVIDLPVHTRTARSMGPSLGDVVVEVKDPPRNPVGIVLETALFLVLVAAIWLGAVRMRSRRAE